MELADLINVSIRKSDIFSRYGGEEFILLLTSTYARGAELEAERLRNIVKNHSFQMLKGRVITISLGVSSYPDKRITESEHLITLSDNALFEAKGSGKDRVVVNSEE